MIKRNDEENISPKPLSAEAYSVGGYEFPPLGGGASPVSYEIADRLSKNSPLASPAEAVRRRERGGRQAGVCDPHIIPAAPVIPAEAGIQSDTSGFDIDVVTMGFKGLPKYEEINKNLTKFRYNV